jgi:hypothetical protein
VNHWITLARAHYGKSVGPAVIAAYEAIETAVRNGRIVLPLSSTHYIEGARATDPYRRRRLGQVMWAISRGRTLISHGELLRHELEVALARRFPNIVPRELHLVGEGVAHAFGVERAAYRLPDEARRIMDASQAENLEIVLRQIIERALLTGEEPRGGFVQSYRVDTYRKDFKTHLSSLRAKFSSMPREQWEDALHAMCLIDIMDAVNEVLALHGLTAGQMMKMGKTDLTNFLQELPSRAVDLHLHRQVLRNPQFKPKDGDLDDWSALGVAAAWCDIVVCEKHTADLLGRDRFQTRARVLRRIEDLPAEIQSN